MVLERRRSSGPSFRVRRHGGAGGGTAAAHAQIVYLLPEGFEAQRLAARLRAVAGAAGLVEQPAEALDLLALFCGEREGEPLWVEVRARTATLRAPSFAVRRDLLLLVMDLVAGDGSGADETRADRDR